MDMVVNIAVRIEWRLVKKKDINKILPEINRIYKGRCDFSNVVYKNAYTPIEGILPDGTIWKVRLGVLVNTSPRTPYERKNHLVYNNDTGTLEEYIPKDKKTTEQFITEAKMKHGDKYDYSCSKYTGACKPIEIICKIHGKFTSTPDHHVRVGTGCPKCKNSIGENEVMRYLENNNIKYFTQYKFKNCKNIRELPFDFYLPEHNLCIEYQGIQHYQATSFSKKSTEEEILRDFEELQYRDNIKKEFCQENNISLLCIPYTEPIKNYLDKYFRK